MPNIKRTGASTTGVFNMSADTSKEIPMSTLSHHPGSSPQHHIHSPVNQPGHEFQTISGASHDENIDKPSTLVSVTGSIDIAGSMASILCQKKALHDSEHQETLNTSGKDQGPRYLLLKENSKQKSISDSIFTSQAFGMPSGGSLSKNYGLYSSSNIGTGSGKTDKNSGNHGKQSFIRGGSVARVPQESSDMGAGHDVAYEDQDMGVPQASFPEQSAAIPIPKKQHRQQSSRENLARIDEIKALTREMGEHDLRNLIHLDGPLRHAAHIVLRESIRPEYFDQHIHSMGSDPKQWKKLMAKHPGMQKFVNDYQNGQRCTHDKVENGSIKKKKHRSYSKAFKVRKDMMRRKKLTDFALGPEPEGELSEHETEEQREMKKKGVVVWQETANFERVPE